MPSRRVKNSVPEINVKPTGQGRVKGFSGSGVTASFESQKEIDDHEVHEAQKEAGRRPTNALRSFRFKGNSAR